MNKDICEICGNHENFTHITVRERMLDTLDEFIYFQCSNCGCLQISSIPDNLDRYYPDNYYSYKQLDTLVNAPARKWVDSRRIEHLVFNRSISGKFFNRLFKPLEYITWVKYSNVKKSSKILDVGSGQGRLLLRMSLGGFTNLTGIDPYLNKYIEYNNGVKILKTTPEEYALSGQKFDFIMLHHSLEHMTDQAKVLQSLTELLSDGGIILIRIPLSDSYARKKYQEHWVQLDAPRHLYLHSKKSFNLLADKCGLEIIHTIYDSTKFQFTGSELYLRGIPLNSTKKQRNIFTNKQLKEFSLLAEHLNINKTGDQAAFYLRKV